MNRKLTHQTTNIRRFHSEKQYSNGRHNNKYKHSEKNMGGEGVWETTQALYTAVKPAGEFLWKHKGTIAKLGTLGYKLIKKKNGKKDKSDDDDFFKGVSEKVSSVKDKVSSVKDTAKSIATKAGNIYDNKYIQKAMDYIPDSDENARPSYPGERHALLKLKNGKMGRANYMGPGTQILKRLQRGDPPRTYSDGVAKIHDIDYYLASGAKDEQTKNDLIRQADQRMVDRLNRASRKSLDDRININLGRGVIQGKMKLEDLGIMKKGSFGSQLQQINEADKKLLEQRRKEAEMAGYGPSKMLKLNYMKYMKEQQKGKGLRLAGQRGRGKKQQKGKGLGLSGGFLSLIIGGLIGLGEAIAAATTTSAVATALVTGAVGAVGGLAINSLADAFKDTSKDDFETRMKKMKAWVDLAKKEVKRYEDDPLTEKKMGKGFLENFKKAVDLKENKYLALQAKGSGLGLSGKGLSLSGKGILDFVKRGKNALDEIRARQEIIRRGNIAKLIPPPILNEAVKKLNNNPNNLKSVLTSMAPLVKKIVSDKLNLPPPKTENKHLVDIAIKKIM